MTILLEILAALLEYLNLLSENVLLKLSKFHPSYYRVVAIMLEIMLA